MFFVLSKTIGIMMLPTNFLIGVGLLGALLLATRFASLGRKLLIASVDVACAVAGFRRSAVWLLYPLEQRFPPWDATKGAPDGIVVLGGRSMLIFPPRMARRRSGRGRPHHRRRRACAPLSERARHFLRRQRQPDF